MNRNSSPRSAPSRKGNPLLAGILIGMVLGVAIAGGVAWYILKTPGPFVNKEPHEAVKLAPDSTKPAPTKASGVAGTAADEEGKPRFEFYKVLTDKPEGAPSTKKNGDKSATTEGKPATPKAANETYFLQAGAFSSADDADKLKAKLAMLGMEASVQTATIPDKGELHRVRLGPYKSADEMNKASTMLKQNGVNATPMRGQ